MMDTTGISQSYENTLCKDVDNRSRTSGDSGRNSFTTETDCVSKNTGSSSNEANKQASIMKTMTNQEAKTVLFLILAAAAISGLVYYITSSAESSEFITQYDGASAKVIDSFDRIISRIGSINTIGVASTIQGLQSPSYDGGNETVVKNTTWPFVTVKNYEQIAATARELSAALYISLAPVVSDDNRDTWERYSVGKDKAWISDGFKYQEELGLTGFEHNPPPLDEVLMTNYTLKQIVNLDSNLTITVDPGPGPYLPRWQASPVLAKDHVNENLFKNTKHGYLAKKCVSEAKAIFGPFENGPSGNITDENPTTALIATLRSFVEGELVGYLGALVMRLYLPVYDTFGADREVVGVMMSIIHWRAYLRFILPENTKGITAVIENTCDGFFTYELNGPEANVTGMGDFHETKFDKYERKSVFGAEQTILDGSKDGMPISLDGCAYVLHVYPSQKFYDTYKTNTPILITMAVAIVFMVVILTFILYNVFVKRRQNKIVMQAIQTTNIVTSLFPKHIHDRLMGDIGNESAQGNSTSRMLKSFLSSSNDAGLSSGGKSGSPIADLFPACTVMFADISGFTAWSSSRNPDQVFILLQSIYQAFDVWAKRRRVFKVETIGDCYVSVTGLPEPQPDHASIMCRFAWDCQQKLHEVTTELERSLGPDCSDLEMRFGLHSGPVTAGVLRGERARFQLFGDTVNTAARMESTGVPGKIQLTEATATILTKSGKEHWIIPREDLVETKGKGRVKTYWLQRVKNTVSSSAEARSEQSPFENAVELTRSNRKFEDSVKTARFVDWMVEILLDYVKKMIVTRSNVADNKDDVGVVIPIKNGESTSFLDEIQECIQMSGVDTSPTTKLGKSLHSNIITEELVKDLRSYVSIIANMYRQNPFHCFEHACHVTMSVGKLLKRITNPELKLDDTPNVNLGHTLHNYTYGINSDTVAQFAIVFSAMIHDVDHRGCSNAQLIKEEVVMGQKYKNKSVAEQNSLELAWMVLMSDQFARLRKKLFPTTKDLLHFREVIVNTVLATDIFDKELNDLRKARWAKAFAATDESNDDGNQADRKATIVIEHIIQASDVAHTMQHWHVYRKWNKLLFKEMYLAYVDGRMGTNPATFWYKGELAFFENYVIPLANKLKECNVFGVTYDEYLNYALGNRDEWEQKGESIIEEMLEEMAEYKCE